MKRAIVRRINIFTAYIRRMRNKSKLLSALLSSLDKDVFEFAENKDKHQNRAVRAQTPRATRLFV